MRREVYALLIFSGLLLGFAVNANGGTVPIPGLTDSRIRTVFYDPNDVVSLKGHLGYQMMVEFDPLERIENVSIGDSTAWQVTPNRKATLLFLKPMERNATTNMTVVTTLRRYTFELTTAEAKGPQDPTIIFDVRFNYPEESHPIEVAAPPEPPPAPSIEQLNFSYERTGSKHIAPLEVFDDGQMTYFEWPKNGAVPAIFAVAADGSESLVNYVVRGPYIVVEQVAWRFKLRNGKDVATVENHIPAVPKLGASKR